MRIPEIAGFLSGTALLAAVLYSALTGAIMENAWLLLGLLLVNLFISAGLPRITKNREILGLKKGLERFGRLVNKALVWAALFAVYFTGVAFVWALSRVAGKKFMALAPKKTAWELVKEKENPEEAF